MTRKTAIQALLAIIVTPEIAKAQKRLATGTSDISTSLTAIQPLHFHLACENLSGITISRGKEKITITSDQIFDALKAS